MKESKELKNILQLILSNQCLIMKTLRYQEKHLTRFYSPQIMVTEQVIKELMDDNN